MKLLGIFLTGISILALLSLPFNFPTNFHGQVDNISLVLWGMCNLVAVVAFICGLILTHSK